MSCVLRAALRCAALTHTRAAYGKRHRHSAVCTAADAITTSSSPISSGGAAVEPPDVRRLAQLAQIEVTDEEVADWGPKIESIIQWFSQLQQVDLEGVPPALRADVDGSNYLREDEPREFENREEMLQQVPLREGSFVKVPKIRTGSDS